MDNGSSQYQNQFFEACKQIKPDEVDDKNYGLNPAKGDKRSLSSEIESVMEALRLMPDEDDPNWSRTL